MQKETNSGNTNLPETGDQAAFYFHQGTSTHAYDYLGCHLLRDGDKYLYTFRVWAPNALSVSVVGDFNGWDAGNAPSRRWACGNTRLRAANRLMAGTTSIR